MFPLIFYLTLVYSAFALPIINPTSNAILANKAFTRPIRYFNPKPSMRFCKRDGCIPTIKSWFSKLIEKIKLAWASIFTRKPEAPPFPYTKMTHSNHFYEVLGVSPTASMEEIHAAYQKLTLANDPSKNSNLFKAAGHRAKAAFRKMSLGTHSPKMPTEERLAKAKEVLEIFKTPESRTYYDAFGSLDDLKIHDPEYIFQDAFGGLGLSDFIAPNTHLGKMLLNNIGIPMNAHLQEFTYMKNVDALPELRKNLQRVLERAENDAYFKISMITKAESKKKGPLAEPLLHILGKAYADAAEGKSTGILERFNYLTKEYASKMEYINAIRKGHATFEQRLEIQKKHWELIWLATELDVYTNANKAALELLSHDTSGKLVNRLKILSKAFQDVKL